MGSMSTVQGRGSSSVVREAPSDLRLKNWSLVDDAPRAWSAIVGAFALSVFAGYWSQSVGMGLLCFVALNLAICRLWLPTSFEIGSKGICRTVLGRRRCLPWHAIVRHDITDRGVLLLCDKQWSPLTPYRGLYIRGRDQREQLNELVQYYGIARLGVSNSSIVRS